MVEHSNKKVSVRRQCELINVSRSRIYYKGKPCKGLDVEIMNEIIDINKHIPFYGYRRVKVELENRGYKINNKKVLRLMRQVGLQALYPKKKTTIASSAHKKYPYLLRDIAIDKPDKVWSIDITYIKIKSGYVYLVCLIDVFSRKIMGWQLSPFLDTRPSMEALDNALKIGTPEIINSDQGCQFTSGDWISKLTKEKIQISMDGKGRWADNIYIERFWRSLKYESLYLYSFETVSEAREKLGDYICFYNQRRPHQSLGYKTPNSVYKGFYKNISIKMGKDNVDLNHTEKILCEIVKGGAVNSQKQVTFWS